MSEWLSFQIGQIASDVAEIKRKLEELTTLGHRLAVLALLWVTAVGINLAPEEVGRRLAAVLKLIAP